MQAWGKLLKEWEEIYSGNLPGLQEAREFSRVGQLSNEPAKRNGLDVSKLDREQNDEVIATQRSSIKGL